MPYYDDGPDYEYMYKISLIGPSGAGKTNLLSRFIRNEFSLQTRSQLHVEFANKKLDIDEKKIKIQVWDTRGGLPKSSLNFSTDRIRGSSGCVICYDITSRESFEEAKKHLKIVQDSYPRNIVVMLVGNKSDLRHLREVAPEEGQQFADDNGLLFTETSALDNTNVRLAFETLARSIHQAVPIKNKAERQQDEIDKIEQTRNNLVRAINRPVANYIARGKKFGLFAKSIDRGNTMRIMKERIEVLLPAAQVSPLTHESKISIARHILDAINETQASHKRGSLFGAWGITSSRLATALQQSLHGFLGEAGLTMGDLVNADADDEPSDYLLT